MITLNSTTDKLQLYIPLAITTNNINCYVTYRDTTTTSISPIGYTISSSGNTTIDLVSSPSSLTQRLVEYININNTDTEPIDVSIIFFDNGTSYTLQKVILQPSDRLEYSDKNGFKVLSNVGTLKTNNNQIIAPTNSFQSVSVLDRDITISPGQQGAFVPTDSAVFGFPVESNGLYAFELLAFYNTSSTTNGARFNLVGDVGNLTAYYYWKGATTATFTTAYAIANPLASPSTYDASSPATTANHVIMRGFYRAGNDDFIRLLFAPELTSPSTITLKAGTIIFFYKVA
jgi:hypothetical protein